MKKLKCIPKNPVNDYSANIVQKRLKFISNYSKTKLSHVTDYSFDPCLAKGNLENFIGVTQLPLGIAGPLSVNGDAAKGDYLIPLATTEGSLVVSYDMGMRTISKSGGVSVKILKDSVHISPVFRVENIKEASYLSAWVKKNYKQIKAKAESTTRHGNLTGIDPVIVGRGLILRFSYTTGDAMGANMVTIATEKACDYISSKVNKKYFIKSNFSSDKKPSSFNHAVGYGKSVFAEAIVSGEFVKYMGIAPEDMFEYYKAYIRGSSYCGMVGMNGHVANGIAALFLACGQDVAEVVSTSTAISTGELTPSGDIYLSIYIPSLMVGTVGGGTSLPTQKECLKILGCYGPNKVKKFAEIAAAVALAGEFSICAAITEGTFVKSFKAYGRKVR